MEQATDLQAIQAAEEAAAVEQNRSVTRGLASVLRQKKTVLVPAVVLAVLVALYSLRLKPYYTATVEFVPPALKSASASALLSQFSGLGGVGDAGGLAGLGSALQAKGQSDSFIVIMTAWPVEDRVATTLKLADVYHTRSPAQTQRVLRGCTQVKGDKGFVTVTVRDADKNRAALIANTYIDAVRDFMKGMALTEASQRRIFYEEQLGKVKDNLATAESDFKQMQQSSHMLTLDSQARLALQSAAELRSSITAHEVELQRLRSYLTDSNSQVQIAETDLAALRRQLAQAESGSSNSFSGAGLSSVPAAEVGFVRASRELKYQETLYELILKQYEASRIDEAKDAPVVQVIEPARPAEFRAGPHRLYLVLGAFAAGLVLGMFYVLLRNWRAGLGPDGSSQLQELRRAALSW